jgi:hypothetical protein
MSLYRHLNSSHLHTQSFPDPHTAHPPSPIISPIGGGFEGDDTLTSFRLVLAFPRVGLRLFPLRNRVATDQRRPLSQRHCPSAEGRPLLSEFCFGNVGSIGHAIGSLDSEAARKRPVQSRKCQVRAPPIRPDSTHSAPVTPINLTSLLKSELWVRRTARDQDEDSASEIEGRRTTQLVTLRLDLTRGGYFGHYGNFSIRFWLKSSSGSIRKRFGPLPVTLPSRQREDGSYPRPFLCSNNPKYKPLNSMSDVIGP